MKIHYLIILSLFTMIAAAMANNSAGVAGISWNTKIFVVQVFDGLEW